MNAYYLVPTDTAAVLARATALDCQVCLGEMAGVTVYPSVAVVSSVLAMQVIPDDTGQATVAEVQAAITLAETAESDLASAIGTARAQMAQFATEIAAYQTQLAADYASVQGWATLTATEQAAIMGRIVMGFGTVLQAIHDHALIGGLTDS